MLLCNVMNQLGTLFVVSTPIGNLSDITLRALEVLKDVDLILSEDTRETQKLLVKFDINKPQISYRDENHIKVFDNIVDMLNTGSKIALVSDSGTPVISDPGFRLVTELKSKGFDVKTIPGPSALVAALSISGLPTDKFTFLGFLPRKQGQIINLLEDYGKTDATLVIYESPFRVRKLLETIKETLGDRVISVGRELTKIHEEVITGRVSQILAKGFTEKGEFVVLVAKESFIYE